MRARALGVLTAVAGVVLGAVAAPSAYVSLNQGTYGRWPAGSTISMSLQLTGEGALIDGRTSWNAVAADAVSSWNYWLGSVDLIGRVENRSRFRGNGVNDVFFADDAYGDAFGTTVAIALHLVRAGQTTEADVLFNRAYSWNSYRGPHRRGLYDLRRVALHELGHVLLLDHPDDHGQSVDSVMHSNTDDVDDLRLDDIQGVRALYPHGNPVQPPASSFTLPTRAEAVDFRHTMETRSRNNGAPTATTFVDIDGTAVWNAEYIRYRVNRCTDVTARDRVFAQIEGRGIQPVCGAPASISLFPSFGDNDRFRAALETEYRDVLKSTAREYHVGVEYGAWLMREYVWLRITGLTHPQAITRLTTSGFVPAPWPPALPGH